MILEIWDREVSPHLDKIEAAAEIIVNHTRALIFRPDFTTFAQDNLSDVERVLEAALQNVRDAIAEYGRKEIKS